ncbi:hypothetical protein OKW38_001767 [Paraburkholderia sp. MM5496-R1]
MKALVYHGPGEKSLDERPIPELTAPTDAIVKVAHTTICGTDLHILKGDVPTCEPGRILGHEGVGVVHQVGEAVSGLAAGDHVLISCITSCGRCDYCRRGMYSHCTTGGWILGNRIDGTQAEYVRIPHAQSSLYRIPAGLDEEALVMLSDILPTGFECGVLNGKVQPGCTVAIGQHRDHDASRRYRQYTDADEDSQGGADRSHASDHASLPARRYSFGLRNVLPRVEHARAEGVDRSVIDGPDLMLDVSSA